MTAVRLKHVEHFRDRHGKIRHYFRVGKGVRTPLKGEPGSPEFMASYHAALSGEVSAIALVRAKRGIDGTFDRLLQDYFSSSDFTTNDPNSTQRAYRRVLEKWVRDEKIGHRLVREMTREHVKKMMGKRADTPGAANDLLKKIRLLMNFAIDAKVRADNPATRVKKYKAGEWHTWEDDELAVFEAHWAIGTKERWAHALHLYTGQRVSDVSHMDDTDIVGDQIRVVQDKTGVKVWIPLHPDLKAIDAATPRLPGPLIKTKDGVAYTEKGLANFMADTIDATGLPERCVTHGLRKAAARLLAEAGCTAHQIMAITGHKTLAEVERYTRAAAQKKLAVAAMDLMPARIKHPAVPAFPNPISGLGRTEEKSNKNSDETEQWRSLRESNPSYQIENLVS